MGRKPNIFDEQELDQNLVGAFFAHTADDSKKYAMKLTQKQRDQLWGEQGPYSEARLTIETRILDDSISRIFIVVEVSINPLTYEIISKNIKRFADDEMITQLIAHCENRGQNFGYVSMAFIQEYCDESVMKKAQESLEYAESTIIKMHKFVMDLLDLER